MRGQFIPVPYISDRIYGVYKIADWLSAGYIRNIGSLIVQQLYQLEARDCPFPELLSYRLYGTTDYWWILCWANGVINPMTDMNPGDSWQIPTYDSIQTMLSQSNLGANSTNQVGQVVTI